MIRGRRELYDVIGFLVEHLKCDRFIALLRFSYVRNYANNAPSTVKICNRFIDIAPYHECLTFLGETIFFEERNILHPDTTPAMCAEKMVAKGDCDPSKAIFDRDDYFQATVFKPVKQKQSGKLCIATYLSNQLRVKADVALRLMFDLGLRKWRPFVELDGSKLVGTKYKCKRVLGFIKARCDALETFDIISKSNAKQAEKFWDDSKGRGVIMDPPIGTDPLVTDRCFPRMARLNSIQVGFLKTNPEESIFNREVQKQTVTHISQLGFHERPHSFPMEDQVVILQKSDGAQDRPIMPDNPASQFNISQVQIEVLKQHSLLCKEMVDDVEELVVTNDAQNIPIIQYNLANRFTIDEITFEVLKQHCRLSDDGNGLISVIDAIQLFHRFPTQKQAQKCLDTLKRQHLQNEVVQIGVHSPFHNLLTFHHGGCTAVGAPYATIIRLLSMIRCPAGDIFRDEGVQFEMVDDDEELVVTNEAQNRQILPDNPVSQLSISQITIEVLRQHCRLSDADNCLISVIDAIKLFRNYPNRQKARDCWKTLKIQASQNKLLKNDSASLFRNLQSFQHKGFEIIGASYATIIRLLSMIRCPEGAVFRDECVQFAIQSQQNSSNAMVDDEEELVLTNEAQNRPILPDNPLSQLNISQITIEVLKQHCRLSDDENGLISVIDAIKLFRNYPNRKKARMCWENLKRIYTQTEVLKNDSSSPFRNLQSFQHKGFEIIGASYATIIRLLSMIRCPEAAILRQEQAEVTTRVVAGCLDTVAFIQQRRAETTVNERDMIASGLAKSIAAELADVNDEVEEKKMVQIESDGTFVNGGSLTFDQQLKLMRFQMELTNSKQTHELQLKTLDDQTQKQIQKQKSDHELALKRLELDNKLETKKLDVKVRCLELTTKKNSSRSKNNNPFARVLAPMKSSIMLREFPDGSDPTKLCFNCDIGKISIFRHQYVASCSTPIDDLISSDIRLICKDCIVEGSYSFPYTMSKSRSESWVYRNGSSTTGLCNACRVPTELVHVASDWALSHDIPFSKGGSSSVNNLHVCHTACNELMADTSFVEYWEQNGMDVSKNVSENLAARMVSKNTAVALATKLRTKSIRAVVEETV
jgi:hypothetical protein